MEIKLQSPTGEIYEAKQKDNNTFVVSIEGEEYKISLFNSNNNKYYDNLSEEQKKKMTKVIFENRQILKQLDASNTDTEDEDVENIEDFQKVIREVNSDYKS